MIARLDTTPTPELEAWIEHQRAKTVTRFLNKKLDTARNRHRKSILLPVETAQRMLDLVHLQHAAQGEDMNKENDNG